MLQSQHQNLQQQHDSLQRQACACALHILYMHAFLSGLRPCPGTPGEHVHVCPQLDETKAELAARHSAVQGLRTQAEQLTKDKEELTHALQGAWQPGLLPLLPCHICLAHLCA